MYNKTKLSTMKQTQKMRLVLLGTMLPAYICIVRFMYKMLTNIVSLSYTEFFILIGVSAASIFLARHTKKVKDFAELYDELYETP